MNRLLAHVACSVVCLLGLAEAARADANALAGSAIGASGPFTCTAGTTSFSLALRSDFSDVGLFTCPKKADLFEAVGAKVSLTFDELAHLCVPKI